MSARYAIYLAPAPDGELWRKACGWLARDAATDSDVPFAGPPGLDSGRVAEITADARHYGFHATIKAPFRLRDGATPEALCEAARAFAQGRSAFAMRLHLAALGSFLALVEDPQGPATGALHADALVAFEPFRAPLSEAETARRLKAPLTDWQKDRLAQWGYPYVLDDFRLHFTLTCSLPADERVVVSRVLQDYFAEELARPVPIDAICVFEQPATSAPFRILCRAPFATG